jgi:hypothetical protein
MDDSFEVSINPANFTKEDMFQTILDQMLSDQGEISASLVGAVQDITPVLTGTLRDSATWYSGDGNKDGQQYILGWVEYDPDQQVDTYNTVYSYYQEGPPMGLETYTNPPRQMLAKTAGGDGMVFVQAWGEEEIQKAVDRMCGGKGIIP